MKGAERLDVKAHAGGTGRADGTSAALAYFSTPILRSACAALRKTTTFSPIRPAASSNARTASGEPCFLEAIPLISVPRVRSTATADSWASVEEAGDQAEVCVERLAAVNLRRLYIRTVRARLEPAGVGNTGDAGGSLTAAYDDSLA